MQCWELRIVYVKRVYRAIDAHRRIGEHERSIRVSRGEVESSLAPWMFSRLIHNSSNHNVFTLGRKLLRQVQKSDRINSDRQSGSDQLGSSRIMKKKSIKLNEIETFTNLKVKIPVKNGKMGQIKKDLRRFSVSCRVVKPPFCILSASSSRTHVFISCWSIHPWSRRVDLDDHGPRWR